MSTHEQVKSDTGSGFGPVPTQLPMAPAYNGYQMGLVYQPPLANNALHEEVHHHDDNSGGRRNNSNDDEEESPPIPEKHLNLEFEACFKEHKSTQTVQPVYKAYGLVFNFTKLFLYNLFVIVFGIPLAILWGFLISLVVFIVTWIYHPGLKIVLLVVNATLPIVTEPLKALFTPLADVVARVFRQIRINATMNGDLLTPLSRTAQFAEQRV